MTTEALAKQGPLGLAERPSFIKTGDTRGTENIGVNDIKPPSLRIAQSMSKEMKRAESVYMPELREGDLFNSVTKRIYGGAVKFLIVNQLGHRHIEFASQADGGGVVDFNVPDGDPRTNFTEGVKDGKKVRERPKATKFYDYLVLVLHSEEDNELMTMSLKSTQLKKGVELNTILAGMKMPSFALVIAADVVAEHRGGNAFMGWKFTPAGYPSEAQYNEASGLYDLMKGKNIEVATEGAEPDVDPDIPF